MGSLLFSLCLLVGQGADRKEEMLRRAGALLVGFQTDLEIVDGCILLFFLRFDCWCFFTCGVADRSIS